MHIVTKALTTRRIELSCWHGNQSLRHPNRTSCGHRCAVCSRSIAVVARFSHFCDARLMTPVIAETTVQNATQIDWLFHLP